MDISTGSVLAVGSLSLIGLAAYLFWKRGLPKVRVQHGLDPQTASLASCGISTVDSVAQRGFDAATHFTTTVGEVVDKTLAPVSQGLGKVLEATAERIRIRQTEVDSLRTKAISLAREIERLKARQIDVTSMTAQLKLCLIEVSQQYYSWDQHEIENVAESAFTQASKTEYAGLRRASYKIQIGVDVEDLRFEIVDRQRIQVGGLRQARILGLKDLKVDSPFDEIRQLVTKGTVKSARAEILTDDARLHQKTAAHTAKVIKEVQAEQSVEHLITPNASLALAFLNACLSPAGFKVEEAPQPLKEPLRFLELCLAINKRVDSEVQHRVDDQAALTKKSAEIQQEVLQLALDAR